MNVNESYQNERPPCRAPPSQSSKKSAMPYVKVAGRSRRSAMAPFVCVILRPSSVSLLSSIVTCRHCVSASSLQAVSVPRLEILSSQQSGLRLSLPSCHCPATLPDQLVMLPSQLDVFPCAFIRPAVPVDLRTAVVLSSSISDSSLPSFAALAFFPHYISSLTPSFRSRRNSSTLPSNPALAHRPTGSRLNLNPDLAQYILSPVPGCAGNNVSPFRFRNAAR